MPKAFYGVKGFNVAVDLALRFHLQCLKLEIDTAFAGLRGSKVLGTFRR
jgi:hypothetical protein